MARLKENDTVLDKWVMTTYQYPSKPELGDKSVWHFDRNKNPHGCWKVDHTPSKEEPHPKVKVVKTQSYGSPVAIVFKTSKNANAKTKMKIWNNTNIDYILTQDTLPGVPSKAIILELGVGEGLIETWKSKYSL